MFFDKLVNKALEGLTYIPLALLSHAFSPRSVLESCVGPGEVGGHSHRKNFHTAVVATTSTTPAVPVD